MKAFFRNVSPRRAVADLWQVLGAPSEYRAIALVLAALVTGGIFFVMSNQGGRGLPRPPKVIYFPSFLEPRRRSEQALVAVVAEAYVNGVSTRKVERLVEQLPAAQVTALRLTILEGLSLLAAAERLEISAMSVQRAQKKAIAALHQQLSGGC